MRTGCALALTLLSILSIRYVTTQFDDHAKFIRIVHSTKFKCKSYIFSLFYRHICILVDDSIDDPPCNIYPTRALCPKLSPLHFNNNRIPKLILRRYHIRTPQFYDYFTSSSPTILI